MSTTSRVRFNSMEKAVTNAKQNGEDLVKNNNVMGLFRLELDRVKAKGNFTEEEIVHAMNKICQV